MATAKLAKGEANKSLRSRVDYLDRAASYIHDTLSKRKLPVSNTDHQVDSSKGKRPEDAGIVQQKTSGKPAGTQVHLTSHMTSASRRSQIRLSKEIKYTICKRCDARLDPSCTSIEVVENRSRGARKPWADVKVVTCKSCDTAKRFPIGAKRQLKKSKRPKADAEKDSRASRVEGSVNDEAAR